MKQRYSGLSCVVLSLISFVVFAGIVLSASFTYAVDTTTIITVPEACTLSNSDGNYSITLIHGTREITGNNITTSCNDTSGYAIYAVGYSGNSITGNNTDLINTSDTSYNIKTDGSSTYGSSWKLKFTAVSNATIANSYDTYQNIPSTYTKIASYSTTAGESTITPSYQINVNISQPPGTYNGKVKYILVHPSSMSPTYTINYNANGGTGVMSSSTPSSFESFTLPTSTLTAPTGYSFAGWCTVQDQTASGVVNGADPQTTCTGTTYAAGATIPAGTIALGNTLNLYATWTINTYNLTITFAGTGVSSVKVCAVSGNCTGTDLKGTISTSGDSVSGLVYNTAYYLYPSFVSGYTVDSWSKTDSASGAILSSTSDLNPTYTMGEGNGAITITGKSAAPGLCTDADHCMQISTATCGNNMVDSRTGVSYLTTTINNQCYMEQNLYLPTGKTLYPSDTNITRTSWTTPSSDSIPSNSFTTAYMKTGTHTNNTYNVQGGWYNYCAASAGTVCSQTKVNASEDICPAGWRLPTSGEMTNVKNANRSNWKFYAGYYSRGSLYDASSHSIWWSATAYDASYQYYLLYYNGSLYTDDGSISKDRGIFVRCVRK